MALTGCKEAAKPTITAGNPVKLDYAQNFKLEQFDDFYKLSIKVFSSDNANAKSSTSEYILYKGDSAKIPDAFKGIKRIKIPVTRIVALSGNYYAYLKAIGQESKVVGFGGKNFTADSALYAAIESGLVKDVGSGPTLSEEAIYTLHPDIVLTFATGTGFDSDLSKLSAANIPILLLSEWQETSALGRLEWIKLFELLSTGNFEGNENSTGYIIDFNLYVTEKEKYNTLKDSVQNALKDSCVQTLLGTPFSGTWYAPAQESFTGTLLNDAHGCAVFYEKQVLEEAFQKATLAKIWINANERENLIANDSRVQKLAVFQNQNIYYYDKVKGQSGTLDFFENASIYPSKALRDFVIMLHGTPEQQKNLTWYRNIFYN